MFPGGLCAVLRESGRIGPPLQARVIFGQWELVSKGGNPMIYHGGGRFFLLRSIFVKRDAHASNGASSGLIRAILNSVAA